MCGSRTGRSRSPASGEVLVEIAAVGICGSDVHYYEHGRIGDYVVREPMVIGHESAGTVVEVGDGVSPERVGELVALEPGVPCRRCPQCLRGRYNLCPDVIFFATPPVDGSISRFVAFDAAFAHPAPAGLTAEQAAMAEPVSVGIWAARKCGVIRRRPGAGHRRRADRPARRPGCPSPGRRHPGRHRCQ